MVVVRLLPTQYNTKETEAIIIIIDDDNIQADGGIKHGFSTAAAATALEKEKKSQIIKKDKRCHLVCIIIFCLKTIS